MGIPTDAGRTILDLFRRPHGQVREEDIGACLRLVVDPQDAAEALLQRAIEAGGSDNVTVLVADGGEIEESPGMDDDTLPRRQYAH